MALPLDLRQQFVDIVQIPAGFQSHFVGSGLIGSGPRGLLNGLKTGANRLIDYPTERGTQPLCHRSRSVQNIVIQGQCCSHDGSLASSSMMSRHQSFRGTAPHLHPHEMNGIRDIDNRYGRTQRPAWGFAGSGTLGGAELVVAGVTP